MQWYERFGVAWAALGDSASSFWDVVTGPFPTDEETFQEVLRTSLRVPVGLGNAAFQTIAGPVQGAAEGLEYVADKATYPVRAYQQAFNLAQSPTWAAAQGYGSALSGGGILPNISLQAFADPDTWEKAWDLAESNSVGQGGWTAGNPLAGGALSVVGGLLWDRPDILNEQQMTALKNDTLFNVVTGLSDAAATWYLDPTVGVGRGIQAARKVSTQYGMGAHSADPWLERMLFNKTKLGIKETDPDVFAQSDRINEFLAWASGKSPRQILAHPMIAKMSKKDDAAGIIAGLLDELDYDGARLVIAHGFGSLTAKTKLSERADDLALRIDNLNNVTNRPLSLELANKGMTGNWLPPDPVKTTGLPRGVPPMSKDSIAAAALLTRKQKSDIPAWTQDEKVLRVVRTMEEADKKKDAKTLALITAAVGDRADNPGIWGDMIYRVPKSGDAKSADRALAYRSSSFSEWEETFIPSKAFGYGTRVVSYPTWKLAHSFTEKQPPRWFDANRKDASPALAAYMRHAGVFDDKVINGRMNEYLSALDLGQRTEVMHKTELEAIKLMGVKHGLTDKQAQLIAKESIGRRNRLIAKLKTGKSDDNVYGVYDEDGNSIKWAAFETQEVNSVPLLDLQAYDRVFKMHGQTLRTLGIGPKFSARQFLDDSFEVFNGLWSATNLLRVGYTMRNITDDTLRALASLGSMAIVGNISAGVKAGLGANTAIRARNIKTKAKYGSQHVAVSLMAKLLGTEPEATRTLLEESFDQMGRDLGSVTTQSALGVMYRGAAYRSPYDHRAESYQTLVGSSFNNINGTSADILANLRRNYQEWGVLKPDADGHMDAWVHAIHNQIGKSELGRKFLEGMTAEEVHRWLTKSSQGRAVLARLGRKDKNNPKEKAWSKKSSDEVYELVGRAQAIVDNYVPILDNLPDPLMLRKMALEGKVDKNTLDELFPSIGLRPSVHGPTVDLNLSQGPLYDVIESVTNFGFKWLGQVPTDKLVRHPVFRRLYINNIKQYHNLSELQVRDEAARKILTDQGRLDPDGEWTSEHLRQVEHIARERSLKQINELLYDGSTKSNIAHKLRFVSAFFSAWEDSMTKWARIAVEKPQTIVQGAKLWNAPNQANLGATEDEQGNLVPRITVKEKNEHGEWVKAPARLNPLEWNREAYIELRLPEGIAKHIPGHESGVIQISKPSMNLVLQGDPWWLPGAGPVTQFAVGKFVDAYPTTLPEVYKWALPFGSEDEAIYSLLPAWMRRVWDGNESITDQSKATTMGAIAQTVVMDAKLNGRTLPPDEVLWKEIEQRTESYFKLRAFTSFFAPFAVQYKSPYQFYIDKLQNLRAQEKPGDEMSADERFLSTYGDDFHVFTMSMTKNVTGLPASREAWDKSKKVQELIAKDPDLASIYVGQISDPKFDQYVYDAQRKQELQPGSGVTARMARSPREALAEAEVKQGWREFGRYMDSIDAMMANPNVPMDFLDFARQYVAQDVATRNVKWAEEYYKTDPNKVPRTIEKLTQYITDNPRQLLRPEIQTLAKYLQVREQLSSMLDMLKANGLPYTLTAEANRDLATGWKSIQESLVESNTVFGRIFWRYLSNDRLQNKIGGEE